MSKSLHMRAELAKQRLDTWKRIPGSMDSLQVKKEIQALQESGTVVNTYYREIGIRGLNALDDWDFERDVGNYTPEEVTSDELAENR